MRARQAAVTVGFVGAVVALGPVGAGWADEAPADPATTSASEPASDPAPPTPPADDPAPTDPAPGDPGTTDPAPDDPGTTDPVPADPTTEDPTAGDPEVPVDEQPVEDTSGGGDVTLEDPTACDVSDPSTIAADDPCAVIFYSGVPAALAGLPEGAVQKDAQAQGSVAALPFTGAPVGALTAAGFGLVALGGFSVLVGRRRTA